MLLNPILNQIIRPRGGKIASFSGTPFGVHGLTSNINSAPANPVTFSVPSIFRPMTGSVQGAHETNLINNPPILSTIGRKGYYLYVGALDAATVFSVTSVTWGTVAGLEFVDRGGATNALNSAWYGWRDGDLEAMTDSDIVVTMSEAVTEVHICAIEVATRAWQARGTGSGTATGAITVDITGMDREERVIGGGWVLAGSIASGALAEPEWSFNAAGAGPMDALQPAVVQRASSGSAATSSVVAYYVPSVNCHDTTWQSIQVDWPGTPAGDAAAIFVN